MLVTLPACILLLTISASPVSAQELKSVAYPSPVISLEVDAQRKLIFVGSGHRVHVLDSSLSELKVIETDMDFVHGLLLQGERLLVAGGNPSEHGMIEVYSAADWKLLKRKLVHDDVIQSIRAADGKLITGSADSTVCVLSPDTFAEETRYKGHSKRVTATEPLPGTGLILSGGLDDTMRVWSSATGELKRVFTNHQDDVLAIERFPSKAGEAALPRAMTVSRDGTVRFWQPTIGRMIRFKKFDSVPIAGCWIAETEDALIGFENGEIKRLSSQTLKVIPVAKIGEHVFSVKLLTKDLFIIGTRKRLLLGTLE